jgi:hypothetical protein
VLLARSLDLLGGALVAIDGAFFHDDASKASILTKKRLHKQMAALDRNIVEYSAALDANDQAEAAGPSGKQPSGEEIAQRVAAWRQRRTAAAAEHPFGTLKGRAGYRHVVVRGFAKVRGEWS